MNRVRNYVFYAIGLLAVSQPALCSLEITAPLPDQEQQGFIRFEAEFDGANSLFFLLDNRLLSNSECSASPCTFYYDGFSLENGEHVAGAMTLDEKGTQRLDKSVFKIFINNPDTPDVADKQSGEIELILIPAGGNVTPPDPLGLWICIQAPPAGGYVPFYNLDLAISASQGIALSQDMPRTWKVSVADSYFAYIEIDNVSEGIGYLSVQALGHKIVDRNGSMDVSDVMIDSSISISSSEGSIRFE